jgi:hypothetical protein
LTIAAYHARSLRFQGDEKTDWPPRCLYCIASVWCGSISTEAGLAVYPEQRTSLDRPGWSELCHINGHSQPVRTSQTRYMRDITPLRMKMFDHVDHFKAPSFVRIAICYIPPMFRAKAKSRFVFPDKRKRAIACPSRAICVSKRLSKAAPAPNPRNCGLDSLSVSVTLSTRIRYSVYTAWSASSLAQQTHSKRSCRASVKCHCFAGASEHRRLCN